MQASGVLVKNQKINQVVWLVGTRGETSLKRKEAVNTHTHTRTRTRASLLQLDHNLDLLHMSRQQILLQHLLHGDFPLLRACVNGEHANGIH